MWSSIGSVLLTILFGSAGWVLTSFILKPFLEFLSLRGKIQEELIFYRNVRGNENDKKQYDNAKEALRRLGARIIATDVSSSWVLRRLLSWWGYNLKQASAGLIGLSNSLSKKGEPALHINTIQRSLKLPRDYSDESIAKIELAMRAD